ncbi:hypothetical protein COEREDRAFT_81895 [Coemansia reversa NRRL 1564]|uniref:TPR-like protein n=1 Tax=Coemansia reversa (strain ATCC 12441 / NRRL 1564) TaxID=763665 RepID=A0A2G5BA10_COERN|nr:hypothetical protein COEREDRAFT_81895 [Coemansia reversa NRRL 1564]|eukprot:PIA15567.1 hypothetical protein COEREDRAFT_81895 [Coemansia reversa NRRL 1564]
MPLKESASTHDANLVDILLGSSLDGEFVRDQIAGVQRSYNTGNSHECNHSLTRKQTLDKEQLDLLRKKELEAVRLAENDYVEQAILQLTQIIEEYPQYGSAYNNRAQAYRLQPGMANKQLIIDDLDAAIKYADNVQTIGHAYTQKAILLREMGQTDDEIFYNFSQGAKYGNEIARMAVARENPYAKLCGKMMTETMRQLRNPPGSVMKP